MIEEALLDAPEYTQEIESNAIYSTSISKVPGIIKQSRSILVNEKSYDACLALHNAVVEYYQETPSANRIQGSSVRNARTFLQAMPTTIPLPEVVVHPDAQVAFEWLLESRRILTISFDGNGRIFYAFMIGGIKGHGVEYFIDKIPLEISRIIQRLYSSRS